MSPVKGSHHACKSRTQTKEKRYEELDAAEVQGEYRSLQEVSSAHPYEDVLQLLAVVRHEGIQPALNHRKGEFFTIFP